MIEYAAGSPARFQSSTLSASHSLRLALAAGAALALAGAAAADVSSERRAAELLVLASAERHLEEWTEQNATLRSQARASLGTETALRLDLRVWQSFRPERLFARIARGLAPLAEDARARAVRAGYASGPGRALQAALEDAATPPGLREQPAFVSRLATSPPSDRRVELIQRVDRATHRSENSVAVALAVGEAVARGAEALGCGDARDPRLHPRARSRVVRVSRNVQRRTVITLLFELRDSDDDALATLVEWLESPPARWLHDALRSQLGPALNEAALEAEAALAADAAARCAEPSGRS